MMNAQWAPWAEDPDEYEDDDDLMLDFNPNHHPAGTSKGGQFAPKESGSSSISMEPDPDKTAEIIFGDLVPKDVQERMAKDIAIAKAMPETYLDNSPQRLLMREKIAEKLYNKDIEKRVQGREATIILGLPGAGKSTLANPLLDKGAIEIDPDIVKGEIPEFNGGIGANAVHEESSAINKEILKRAIANGDNIVWPRINGKDKLKRDVEMMQKNGYTVKVQIINVTPETAIRSAVDRYLKSGRLVSPSTIIEYGNTPMETYEAASQIPGVTVERYKRDHGKGVERDHTQDAFTVEFLADAFDPDQPRDWRGRWAETGISNGFEGGGGGGSPIGPDTLKNTKRIQTLPELLSFVDYYNKQGEILNPDFERLKQTMSRMFEGERNGLRDVIHPFLWEGDKQNRFAFDLSHESPYETRGLAKFKRYLDKIEGSNENENMMINAAKAYVDKWIPIAATMNELKGKAVKVTAKREQAKKVAEQELESKYRDSAPLIKLFESHLEEYKRVAGERAQEHVDSKLKIMENNGWDLNKVAPEPDWRRVSRDELKVMESRRSNFSSILTKKADTGYYSKIDNSIPDIRAPDPEKIKRYVDFNIEAAEGAYRDFMQKMTEKIGKPVTKADMTGSIWTNAILNVETDDGGKQSWHTQMILNFSKYDKMFNQFPSRRKDVKDYNPYHDPETGQFTTAGWFTGSTVIKRNGRKTSPREHKVFAEHPDDVPALLIGSRKATALKTDEVLVQGEIKQVAGDTRTHRAKLPNKGSKEYEALQEMQRRVDQQSGGYKGD